MCYNGFIIVVRILFFNNDVLDVYVCINKGYGLCENIFISLFFMRNGKFCIN